MFVVLVALVLVVSLATVYAVGGNGKGNGQTDNPGNSNSADHVETLSTFVPWQQRTEAVCPEACGCQGAVVSCPTENGKTMRITAGNSGNVITLAIEKTEVNTTLELERDNDNETNRSRIRARLSNGKNAEIKIMPDVASERALDRLRLRVCNVTNNCTIVLKEVGKDKPNATEDSNNDLRTVTYEMQIERHARILGIFQAKVQERAEVNAENGNVKLHGPWWMFLATKEE